jgi:hypothetical protein
MIYDLFINPEEPLSARIPNVSKTQLRRASASPPPDLVLSWQQGRELSQAPGKGTTWDLFPITFLSAHSSSLSPCPLYSQMLLVLYLSPWSSK